MSAVRFKRIRRLGGSARLSVTLVLDSGRLLPGAVITASLMAAVLAGAEVLTLRSVVASVESEQLDVALLVLFGVVAAGRRTIIALSGQLQWVVSERVQFHATSRILDAASLEPFGSFEDPAYRDELQRALTAARSKAWAAVWAAVTVMTAGFTAVALVVVLLALMAELLLVLGAAGVVLFGASLAKSRWTYSLGFVQTTGDRERAYLEHALTSTSEGKEIRLFGGRMVLLGRHRDLYQKRLAHVRAVASKRVAADLISNLAMAGAVVIALWVIADRTISGSLDLADAAAGALAVQQLTAQLQVLGSASNNLVESSLFVDDISRVIGRPQEELVASEAAISSVHLSDVTFAYPQADTVAISGVSFDIEAGQVVAVVGENGSGKSTLAKVATGLYQPLEGTVEVASDGLIESVESPLVGRAAALFQDYGKYEMTVEENVWIGQPAKPIERDRVRRALESLALADRFDRLEDGLGSRIGRQFSDGLDLSIGEWQRLALARILYSDASFVVLDEPTSSADAAAEAAFFAQLRTLLPGRAVLLISHRFASVRTADLILVMSDGAVVERGTHEELMALDGVYSQMYRIQTERLLGLSPS